MYSFLQANTEKPGGVTFNAAVTAFVDMPGVSTALGFKEGTLTDDIATGAKLLHNMKATFETHLSSHGARFEEQRRVVESMAWTMHGPNLNTASVTRVTGISLALQQKGAWLHVSNTEAPPESVKSSVPIQRRLNAYPFKRVFDWFHGPECTKVEMNKETKRKYSTKLFTLPDGEIMHLDCDHRIRFSSKEELAASYLESAEHARIMKEDPSRKICLRSVQECIC
jgi:hypothetical protein